MSVAIFFIIAVVVAGVLVPAIVYLLVLRPSRAPTEAPMHFLCSACFQTHPMTGVHVLPWWNESMASFNTTYRCPACWPRALAETRAIVSADMPADQKASMQDFLRRHRHDDLADALTTPEETRAHLLEFLDRLERRDIILDP
jgi:hypothetical protein